MNLLNNKIFFSLFPKQDPSNFSILNPKPAYVPVDLENDVIYARTALKEKGINNKVVIFLRNELKVYTDRTLKQFKQLCQSFSFVNKGLVVNLNAIEGASVGLNLLLTDDKAFKVSQQNKKALKIKLGII